MKVQNPHDRFFKELFSVRENALDFINGAFPAVIRDRIIPESLKLDTSSYTDEKLDEYFSDIVCLLHTEIGQSCKVNSPKLQPENPHFCRIKVVGN